MGETFGLEYTFDIQAEQAVLSTVMLDPSTLAEVQPLIPSAIVHYDPRNQSIYQAQLDLDAAGTPIDPVTVAKRLKEMNRWANVGAAYLAHLTDATPAVGNVAAHARIVRDKWRLRVAMAKAQTVVAEIKSGAAQSPEDVQAMLEGAELAFGDLAHQQAKRGLRAVKDVMGEATGDLDAQRQRGSALTGTDTGYPRLNAKLAGLHDTDLVIVAGRPGSGKTAFTMNIATRVAAAGAGVAIFSLEQPDLQLAYRLIGAEARLNLSLFRMANAIKPEQWPKIAQAIVDLSALPVWIDDTPAITVADMRSRIRQLKQQIARSPGTCTKGLRLVVVDYLQLAQARGEKQNREQQVSEISRTLKALAKQERLCIMAASQLNRGLENRAGGDKRPQLSDLRESGAIEQDADTVMFVYRPEMYLREPDPMLTGLAEIIIGKQRNGPTGTVRLAFSKESVRFDPLADTDLDLYDAAEDDDSWYENG